VGQESPIDLDSDDGQRVGDCARLIGVPCRRMVSLADHDAQYFASVMPTGTIFVPSEGGCGNSPREFTKPQQLQAGFDVMLKTLLALDAALSA